MALTDYTGLVAAVANWLHRDDIAADAPTFIDLATERISADLADLPLMLTTGTATIASLANSFAMPVDAIGLHTVRITDSYTSELTPMELLQMPGADSLPVYGRPSWYAANGMQSTGAPLVTVHPYADQAYTVALVYPRAVPAISASSTTNFVTLRAPSLYLFAALVESAPFVGQDARHSLWETKYQEALERFKGLKWHGETRLRSEAPLTGAPPFNIQLG